MAEFRYVVLSSRAVLPWWLIDEHLGSATELMGDLDGALHAYEQALRHNFQSIQAMNAISCILRTKENFPRAVEYLQGILKLDGSNGEVWGSLGQYHSPRFFSESDTD